MRITLFLSCFQDSPSAVSRTSRHQHRRLGLPNWPPDVTGDVTTGSWSQMTGPTPWTASDDLMMSYPFMIYKI